MEMRENVILTKPVESSSNFITEILIFAATKTIVEQEFFAFASALVSEYKIYTPPKCTRARYWFIQKAWTWKYIICESLEILVLYM